jgi:hypothetical protein
VAPYDRALDAASASGVLYDGFDRVVSVAGTLITPAFERALHAELSRLQRDEIASALGLGPEPEGGTALILFLDARRPGWEDLDRRTPTFRVEIVTGQGRLPATFERRLDDDDATLRHLFPWTHDFGHLYRLRVSAALRETDGLRLRVSGAPGSLEVRFPSGT